MPRAGPPQGTIPRVVSPQSAERFVVASLRLLAAAFALVGLLFIIAPDGVLGTLDEIGEWFGDFTPAPASDERLWLGLAFAYMVVITAVCLVAQADVARYRPLLLVLAVGKAASSLAALGFFIFDADVFPYLVNFVVDGALVGVALYLWRLAGRIGPPAAPS